MIINTSNIKLDEQLLYLGYSTNIIKYHSSDRIYDCILAYKNVDNDLLKYDAANISEIFKTSVLIKETDTTKLTDGKKSFNVEYLPESTEFYLFENFTVRFIEEPCYIYTIIKEELVEKQTIQYRTDNGWKDKIIENIEKEWVDYIQLLSKDNKIRYVKFNI